MLIKTKNGVYKVTKICNGWSFSRRGGQPMGNYDERADGILYIGEIWKIDNPYYNDRWGWHIRGLQNQHGEGVVDGKDEAKRKVEEWVKEAIRKNSKK